MKDFILLNQLFYNFLARLEESQISDLLSGNAKLRIEA